MHGLPCMGRVSTRPSHEAEMQAQVEVVPLGNGGFELSKTALAGLAPLAPMLLEELLAGFKESGVAYLDLAAMPLPAGTGLTHIGPSACLAGEITQVEGQLGGSSQVPIRLPK